MEEIIRQLCIDVAVLKTKVDLLINANFGFIGVAMIFVVKGMVKAGISYIKNGGKKNGQR